MYVCLPAWLLVCVYICMAGWMYFCMYVCMHVCMPGCLTICMSACMFSVLISVSLSICHIYILSPIYHCDSVCRCVSGLSGSAPFVPLPLCRSVPLSLWSPSVAFFYIGICLYMADAVSRWLSRSVSLLCLPVRLSASLSACMHVCLPVLLYI